ncbi:MAG TPA: hypothetical protein VGR16_13170 [Thermomicrobiales bacterium]|nr:hypothetical protein [Thermomicrobiales bacterium]
MVTNPRAPARAGELRALNQPVPVQAFGQRPDGAPRVVVERGRQVQVEEVCDTWLVEDEWWRKPICRLYFRLLLTNGVIRTVYHDLVEDQWYAQEYGT